MPIQGEPPGIEAISAANILLAVAGWSAALMIRLTGAGHEHRFRFVVADIAGTLGLFYLAFLGLWGYGLNILLAVSLAGFAAAAGWAAVFALLQRLARNAPK